MSKENRAYIVQLIKQIVHPYFAEEIADILIAHGMTFKTEPQTNADRIRAMSDEELAATMYGLTGLDEHIQFCQNKAECEVLLEKDEEIPDQDCIRCLVAWLKQPAVEGEHE